MTPESHGLQRALQHHQNGQLREAELLYRQILQLNPDSPDALHLLGVIAHQVGKNETAVEHFRRAVALRPHFPEAYNNFGLALAAMGRLAEAGQCYESAIRQMPELAEAHNNFGNCLKVNGRSQEAIESYQRAIKLRPDYATAKDNLAKLLRELELSVRGAKRRVRVGVVGCGWFALTAHIPALNQLAAEGALEVAALCSRNRESLARAVGLIGHPVKLYSELGAILSDQSIDLVDLVLPTPLMADAVRQSLRAGKHVLSEKPCAPTAAECSALLSDYAATGATQVWAVAENWRFKRMVQAITEVVKSGGIGALSRADFQFATSGWRGDRGWRSSGAYAGGYVLDSGVHFASMLRGLAGEIEEASAVARFFDQNGAVEAITADLMFHNGVRGKFTLSFAQDAAQPAHHLALSGSDGTLYANFLQRRIEIRSATLTRTADFSDDDWVHGGVLGGLRDCVDSIYAGTLPRSSPTEAARDVAAIEAMLHSSRVKQPVRPSALLGPLNGCGRRVAGYAGLNAFRPKHFAACSSIADISRAVTEAASRGLRVRAMGTGYSWPGHFVTEGVCLRVTGLDQILAIDTQRKTIRVGAGALLGNVTRALASRGLCLPSLPFLSSASVGGMVATGTHGTSPRCGTVSDFVRSMKVVRASGELVTVDVEDLPAARVSVGTLGVVVEVELQAVDMPWVRYARFEGNLPQFLAQHTSILAHYDHVWVCWRPAEDRVWIHCLEASPAQKQGFVPYVANDNAMWEKPRQENLPAHPNAIGGQDGVFMSMQYGVPLHALPDATDLIKRSVPVAYQEGREIEMKFLKGTAASCLGPNAGIDSVLFNLWWHVERERRCSVFADFEAAMRSVHARPHWGKLHALPDADYMRRAYPEWDRFEAVRRRLDPKGVFSIRGS